MIRCGAECETNPIGCATGSYPKRPLCSSETVVASDRQLRANRANAKKSTGPRTPTGKDAVRLNALKHGLLARVVLLPDDDREEFAALSQALADEFQPVGAHEQMIFDMIVAYHWRLRRVFQVENGIFSAEIYMASDRVRRQIRLAEELNTFDDWPAKAERDPGDPLAQAGVWADRELVDIGEAFRTTAASGSDAFTKLSRYETMIFRALLRAIDRLQAEQQKRLDAGVAGPSSAV